MQEVVGEVVPQRKGSWSEKQKAEGGRPFEGNENADSWVLIKATLEQVHVAQWSQRSSQATARGNSSSAAC